jgi:hypothetical protein
LAVAAAILDGVAVGSVLLHARYAAPCTDYEKDPEQPAGAVVFYGDEGLLTAARVEGGVQLLMSGAVDEVYFVGGWRPLAHRNGAEQMAAAARQRGADPARVAHDAGSYDSISSMTEALERAKERELAGIVLVSDQLHLARLIRVFRSAAVETGYTGGLAWRCAPEDLSPPMTFARAHHEAAAIALGFLAPEDAQRALTAWLRGQGDPER